MNGCIALLTQNKIVVEILSYVLPADKGNNRLTTLTGMTGIGKSTELSHLVESSSYKKHVGNRTAII